MGRGANVVAGVVQDQILEIDEFAVHPQGGEGVGKMGPFDPRLPNKRAIRSPGRAAQCRRVGRSSNRGTFGGTAEVVALEKSLNVVAINRHEASSLCAFSSCSWASLASGS